MTQTASPPITVSSAPKTLFFLRHGETDWNAEGRLQGQTDIPLNGLGREQAADAGRALRRCGVDPGQRPWLVSPLARTRQTAELARDALGLKPLAYSTDDRLKEISFGEWQGQTWPELRRADLPAVRARNADKWGYTPPGGESYAALLERVSGWLAGVGEEAIVVAHGGIARMLMILLAGLPQHEAVDTDVWQGRVLLFRGGRGFWVSGAEGATIPLAEQGRGGEATV